MEDVLTEEQVVTALREAQGDLSLRQYAENIGCTASALSQVYTGKRQPSDNLLRHLNINVQRTYTRRRWK